MPVLERPRPAPGPVSLCDYERLPEGAPFELLHGYLVHRVTGERFTDVEALLDLRRDEIMSPSPTPRHQRIAQRFFLLLNAYVREHGVGEVFTAPLDVPLAAGKAQPDVLFVAAERAGIIGPQRMEGAPDLVAEVLSPSTAYYDLRQKKDAYFEASVREYWILDPESGAVEVYVPGPDDFALEARTASGQAASVLLDGFSVLPADLFAD